MSSIWLSISTLSDSHSLFVSLIYSLILDQNYLNKILFYTLVNSGSTYYFVDSKFVDTHHLKTSTTPIIALHLFDGIFLKWRLVVHEGLDSDTQTLFSCLLFRLYTLYDIYFRNSTLLILHVSWYPYKRLNFLFPRWNPSDGGPFWGCGRIWVPRFLSRSITYVMLGNRDFTSITCWL